MSRQDRVWQIGWVVGIFLVIFLAAISLKEFKSIAYVGRDVPIMNSITVNGKGESVSIPDIATFSFSVTEMAKQVDQAQSQATDKINAVIKALKDGGVAENDIKTTSYNISPHYEYNQTVCLNGYCPSGKPILTGYDVSQSIEVKIRDLKKAGALFATVGSMGVQNVNGLTFSIDDIDTIKSQARELAIKNAQEKAKTLSNQLGVHLVRITSFYDQSDEPVYPYGIGGDAYAGVSMKAQSAVAPVPDIPSGEQKVTSRVSITYEIR